MSSTERLFIANRIKYAIEMALRHFAIIIIFSVIALLIVGIISNGSDRALAGMTLFAAIAGISYWIMFNFKSARRLIVAVADALALQSSRTACIWLIGLSAAAIALVHLTLFNGLTLRSSMMAKTNIEVALIRMDLTENLPASMQYLKSIAINALFPIGLLMAVIKRMNLLAAIVAVVGIFYTICMMQKSGPVILALPTLAYFVCTQRWFRALIGSALVVTTVYAMDSIAEPSIRPEAVNFVFRTASIILPNTAPPNLSQRAQNVARPVSPPLTTDGDHPTISAGLFKRMVIVPGDVAAEWFNAVPADIPYAYGCGYRFLTPILGCKFQNYSLILYSKFNPEYANTGLRGSSNAASMMTAYANFGMPGLVISGFLHGVLAWGLYVLFYRTPELSPAFNLPYLLLLSSSDLFTMLLSGGWALTLVLYITLCRPLNKTAYSESLAADFHPPDTSLAAQETS